MEKFDIKKVYGYHWMIISLILQLFCFVSFLGLIFYIKYFSNDINKNVDDIMTIHIIIFDIIFALIFIVTLSIYLYLFLPFKNSNGKVVFVRITERTIFDVMYGEIATEKSYNRVKIIFASRHFIDYFILYGVGDYVRCFVKEQDLANPKCVVLYK